MDCPTCFVRFPHPARCAQVLVQLLDDAEAFTGGEVRKAVVSVPAYFTAAQREATANAGGRCSVQPAAHNADC